MSTNAAGHNSGQATVLVQVRRFNSLSDGDCASRPVELPAGSDIGDLLATLGLSAARVHLVLVNGRDATPWLDGGVNTTRVLDHGDTVALSGPVPYSWGYGSPVV